MRVFYGKAGIKVTVLADSINKAGNRFITFEIEYWRGILAEFNTHRALSKNSFSSRAVPFEKMLNQLTGMPVRFGANQAGMQDKGEDFDAAVILPGIIDVHGNVEENACNPRGAWEYAKDEAIIHAQAFKDAGYHKQVYNRLVEPFQMMKTVVSGTEWSNFFWLRDDDAADPSLHELARVMREAAAHSSPELLEAGEWHLPYIDTVIRHDGKVVRGIYVDREFEELSIEEAIKVSCARCAAVSYRNEGYGLEKSMELYERLVGADRKHASALEHCATPMEDAYYSYTCKHVNVPEYSASWEAGITHCDRKGRLWSGNLCGWIQHRKTVPGENYEV